jgi:hypothetical protein
VGFAAGWREGDVQRHTVFIFFIHILNFNTVRYNVKENQNRIWNSGMYKEEVKDLEFLRACEFFSIKAIDESGLLETGSFVNLASCYGDVWLEVENVYNNAFTTFIEFYRSKYFFKRSITSIVSAKDLKDEQIRVVYSKNGQFGGKNGKPIELFFNNHLTPSVSE